MGKSKFIWLYEEQEFKTLTDDAQAGLIALLGFIEADERM